ncbi:hypothetical protein LTR09_012131 [Extremus antarcticus]|uniref:Uncharacterized protein n=1 Tax=Extremus antarcticus TaxID=702011 RepID=A0AAJ0DAY8_9PEZI|nr:hypothetical protein LTR09_012131 [Extremus antarcticus]
MSHEPLLEEQYAPDQVGVHTFRGDHLRPRQYRVLVTWIFLNKTRAVRARPYLEVFLHESLTPQDLRGADVNDLVSTYFRHLGLHRRAWWLIDMAIQLITDPAKPNVLRRKPGREAGHWSEVGHLAGVGEYASDAWRLYAGHGFSVPEEWRTLRPADKDLRRYVERKKREEQAQLMEDDLVMRFMATRLSDEPAPSDVVIGSGDSTLRVPGKFIRRAMVASAVGSGSIRGSRPISVSSCT